MMSMRFFIYLIALYVTLLPMGCGGKEIKEKEGGHEESPSGASFKVGQGITLTDETHKILGLEIVEVMEEKLPREIQFNIQIFGETHRFEHLDLDHTGCDVHGSGFLTAEKAAYIEPKQVVKLLTSNSQAMDGFIVAVQKQLAHGETEIVVGVTAAGAKLKDGEFVAATITLPREDVVTVIPKSALLRTLGGTYVYVTNGNAYYRTAVKVGSESDNKIEITDGLFAGDQVVTKPVETLWLIELRATKGGGHCH